jgi:asparagine synthase (glutamine-hydrolysing)
MPGIVGVISKRPADGLKRELNRMVESIRHESFYVTGTWVDETLGVYVGWSARKDSFSDGMPLLNEKQDVALVYSGEDFPEPGVKGSLKQRGHSLGDPTSSYLVHLYEDDPKFPAGLNGRFHGILVDRIRKSAILFNDRYGMHRIYYHESADGFYFAAEAKAILAVRPELRTVDTRSLGEIVACGSALENRTLFAGVHLLPPASKWDFDASGTLRKGVYFEPREWEEQSPLEPEAYYKELRTVFSETVPRYFNGQERVGVSLTGGLDTRMIMAWHKPAKDSLPCYSFGGSYRECQDVVVARWVAQACGQSHQVIPVAGDFLSQFPHYAERTVFLTDACIDVSHTPDLYANERARQIAPVRMTGNYGGEVTRRVRLFKAFQPAPGVYAPDFLKQVDTAKETFNRLLQIHPLSFVLFRQSPWHHYGLLSLEQTQVALRSPYLDNKLVRTIYRAPESVCTSNDLCLRLIEDGDRALRGIRTDIGAAGGNGLSAAATRRYLEFTFKAEYGYDYGMPQWVAQVDHLLAPLHIERLFLGRHKFYHFRVWYRDQLSKYIQEMLLDPRTLGRPYLQGKQFESMVKGHVKGNHNYTTAIHRVLTLELAHRLFIDAQGA